MPTIALARATTEEVRAVAQAMDWIELPVEDADNAWQPQAMDARISWRMLDESFGAFGFEGEHAEVAAADLGVVIDLLDDVDVMHGIGAAAEPAELERWASRLGVFAEGDSVYEATAEVLQGLLGSDRREFAAAAVKGLHRARWPGLVEPLSNAAERWPELAADCRNAIASIRNNPV